MLLSILGRIEESHCSRASEEVELDERDLHYRGIRSI